jgi:KilA-N domain
MANSSIIRSWNGRTIRQREDGYLSATDMCQACGKRLNDWMRLSATGEYLKALEDVTGIPATELVQVFQGGTPETQGTWVYRRAAIRLAQWLSPQFAVWVDEWIEELLIKGKIEATQSTQLPPADIRLGNLATTLQTLNNLVGYDFKEPRLNQYTKDLIGDIIVSHAQNRLLPANHPKYLGVAERAEQLGYSVNLVTKNRSQLGKYVKAFGLPSVKEQRLCNGTMRDINLYELTDELDNAIKEFMDAKVLSA